MSSDHPTPQPRPRRIHSRQRIRRNFPLLFIDALGWPLGWAIMSPETIAPAFVLQLTDSPMAVSMIRVVYAVGMWLPILYAPNLIRRVKWRGKYVVGVGMVERLPMLVVGLAAPFLAVSDPSKMLLVFFICWGIRSIAEGVNLSAYASLLDEGVPETYRGRLWGGSSSLSAVLALPIGFWSAHHLRTQPFPAGYATLFIVGFLVLAVTLIPLWWVREVRTGRVKVDSAKTGLASMGLLRTDPVFRRFTVMVVAIGFIDMAVPFYSVHALRTFGLPDSTMGLFAGAQAAAASVGALAFGLMSDRVGFRGPLRGALVLGFLAPCAAFLAPAPWAMYPTFALLGAALTTIVMCRYNMLLEVAPQGKVPEYSGVFYTTVQPAFALAPFLGSLVVEYLGVRAVFVPSMVAAVLAIILLRGVPEPRAAASETTGEDPVRNHAQV
ncbi:MAG: MFS transporter [Armatimonadia bacterium]|nr:MFS transporter [Armatimonadia bacterium]